MSETRLVLLLGLSFHQWTLVRDALVERMAGCHTVAIHDCERCKEMNEIEVAIQEAQYPRNLAESR